MKSAFEHSREKPSCGDRCIDRVYDDDDLLSADVPIAPLLSYSSIKKHSLQTLAVGPKTACKTGCD